MWFPSENPSCNSNLSLNIMCNLLKPNMLLDITDYWTPICTTIMLTSAPKLLFQLRLMLELNLDLRISYYLFYRVRVNITESVVRNTVIKNG